MNVHSVDKSINNLFYFILILLFCYFINVIASDVKCTDIVEENEKHTLCYLDTNFYPLNYGETQKLTFCFEPEQDFQFMAISILNYTLPNELVQIDTILKRNSPNKVTLNIKKNKNNQFENYYSLEIKSNDRTIASRDLLSEEVENGKELEVYLSGPWIGSREFVANDPFERTNCNPEGVLTPTNHVTFQGCQDDYTKDRNTILTTICMFNPLNHLTAGKNPNWKICFKPQNTFQYLLLTAVDQNSQINQNLSVLKATSLYINQFNEFSFAIENLKPYFNIQKIFQNEINLQFLFYGGWEGSRDFSTEDNIYFTNCQNEEVTTQVQTYPSTIQTSFVANYPTSTSLTTSRDSSNDSTTETDASVEIDSNRNDTTSLEAGFQDPVFRLNIILLIAGALLLSLTLGGIICCVVVVILRRQTRIAKEKAKQRQGSLPILQLPKNFQKNRFSYVNVMAHDSLAQNDMLNYKYDEDNQGLDGPDVCYTTVDFQVVSNQEGKSVKEVIIFPKLFKTNSATKIEERNEGSLRSITSSTSAPHDLTSQLKKAELIK